MPLLRAIRSLLQFSAMSEKHRAPRARAKAAQQMPSPHPRQCSACLQITASGAAPTPPQLNTHTAIAAHHTPDPTAAAIREIRRRARCLVVRTFEINGTPKSCRVYAAGRSRLTVLSYVFGSAGECAGTLTERVTLHLTHVPGRHRQPQPRPPPLLPPSPPAGTSLPF